MNYKSYTQYKDSKIEGIGQIPKHWEVVPLTKFLNSIVDYRGRTPEKVDDGIFLVTGKNIKDGKIQYGLSQEFVKEEDYDNIMSRGKPKIGEVLFTTEAPLGEVANIDNPKIALAQRIIKLSGRHNVLDNYFLKYYMMSEVFQSHLQSLATGSTALGIKASKLSLLKLLLVPYSEQQQIVKYLNKKTNTIDEIILKNKELIVLLNEKRVALINKCMTKGLDNNFTMKNSNIVWIGNIPSHWSINRLKHLVLKKAQYGANCEPEEDESNFDYRFVRITDITNFATLKSDCVYLSKDNAKNFILKEGDVLFARSGATVGKSYLYEKKDGNCCFAGYLIKYVVNKKLLNPKFLIYFTFTKSYSEWIKIASTQATIPNVSAEKYDNLLIPLPPIDEQKEIINYLDAEITNINNIIIKIKKNIELLKEYKSSLINNVVVGSIDVTEVKI